MASLLVLAVMAHVAPAVASPVAAEPQCDDEKKGDSKDDKKGDSKDEKKGDKSGDTKPKAPSFG